MPIPGITINIKGNFVGIHNAEGARKTGAFLLGAGGQEAGFAENHIKHTLLTTPFLKTEARCLRARSAMRVNFTLLGERAYTLNFILTLKFSPGRTKMIIILHLNLS